MPHTLEVEYKPQAAVVWLSRPDVRNAVDPLMVQELTETFEKLGSDPQVRAIVLAGRGIGFCAGTDIGQVRYGAQPGEEDQRADALACAAMLHTLYTCPKATIARVHGICMSVGMGLAAACDITIASTQATFALPETRLGLVPALIAPYVLRAIGPRQATRWFLTGETFSANEAWRIGFVHDLCEPESLDMRIAALVDTFMLTAPDAVAATKQMVHEPAPRGPGASQADGAVPREPGYPADGRPAETPAAQTTQAPPASLPRAADAGAVGTVGATGTVGAAGSVGTAGAVSAAEAVSPAGAAGAARAVGTVAASAGLPAGRMPEWLATGSGPPGLATV